MHKLACNQRPITHKASLNMSFALRRFRDIIETDSSSSISSPLTPTSAAVHRLPLRQQQSDRQPRFQSNNSQIKQHRGQYSYQSRIKHHELSQDPAQLGKQQQHLPPPTATNTYNTRTRQTSALHLR
jgi:hypothetical protein